jgi:hypothetical protein
MMMNYEAVVTTTDGTFRAFLVSDTQVCVTEDGIGLVDSLDLTKDDTPFYSPEQLASVLIWYVYERQRGLSIETVSLHLRDS